MAKCEAMCVPYGVKDCEVQEDYEDLPGKPPKGPIETLICKCNPPPEEKPKPVPVVPPAPNRICPVEFRFRPRGLFLNPGVVGGGIVGIGTGAVIIGGGAVAIGGGASGPALGGIIRIGVPISGEIGRVAPALP